MKENYAIIFCFNANLANEIFIFMNIIGNILGVAIESYDDHYPRLHSKLSKKKLTNNENLITWDIAKELQVFIKSSNHIIRGSNPKH